jgi:hypothetical protein
MNHPAETDISADCNHLEICKFDDPKEARFVKLSNRLSEKIDALIQENEKMKEVQGQSLEERLNHLRTPPSLGRAGTCS